MSRTVTFAHCTWVDKIFTHLILPAYGAYVGGLNILDQLLHQFFRTLQPGSLVEKGVIPLMVRRLRQVFLGWRPKTADKKILPENSIGKIYCVLLESKRIS